MVTWIARKQKPFARFQTIAQELIKERKIKCGTAMFKSVETRFASQVSMTERAMQQKKVFKTLAKDELFLKWLGKQQAAQGDPSRGTSSCVHDFVIFLFQTQLFSCLLANCYFPVCS
jgi:hypothetical protein